MKNSELLKTIASWLGLLALAAIALGSFAYIVYDDYKIGEYIGHGGKGVVVSRIYSGTTFDVVVEYTDGRAHTEREYTVREKTFDAIHMGDTVTADQMN